MKKLVILMVVVFLAVPLLAGCVEMFPVTVRGGGWLPYYGELQPKGIIEESEAEGKTSFGFTVECYNAVQTGGEWEYDVRGNLQYVDHNKKMKIRGKVLEATWFAGGGVFAGEYTVDGETGMFTVSVYDDGEPGTFDYFGIYVDGGPYDGYVNEGPLSGGNIQMFTPEPVLP